LRGSFDDEVMSSRREDCGIDRHVFQKEREE